MSEDLFTAIIFMLADTKTQRRRASSKKKLRAEKEIIHQNCGELFGHNPPSCFSVIWGMENYKKCSKCGETKSKTEFGSHKGKKGNKDGLQPRCKICKNKDYLDYKKFKLSTDLKFKMDRRMSKNISRQIKSLKDGRSWKSMVDYSVEELIKHLESKFRDGMTWDNYGAYWHIDHVIPKSFFKYLEYDDTFRACWALNNLQPLLASENLKKNNKVPNPFL